MTLYCAKCGQRVLLRLGVLLSPTRADVFDAIQRQSKYGGIRVDTLAHMFAKTPACMKVHINHINKILRPKHWEIVCERQGSSKGFYKVKRLEEKRQETWHEMWAKPFKQSSASRSVSYAAQCHGAGAHDRETLPEA